MQLQRTPLSVRLIVPLSLLLFFLSLLHSIEDVLHGEPTRLGISTGVFSTGLALLYVFHGLCLYWLGKGRSSGLLGHMLLGLGWGISAIVVHAPEVLAPGVYRSGICSVGGLVGIALVGIALGITSAILLRRNQSWT
jgi:hypothetical protein